ncbi:Peroxisomal N(1)-acetyl-spermine/spermidine oxidase [Portunus trituberculatus]|uniref:Peroxisomal N(1)-acetyl-spermine/spermidine oxidase n=1 Tax=Portunus trituberculatus TaxID=210409 RepID=A0A5B7DU78_PORTR|nr:Peroxisomal N(1)-acetyl-spermine/spermidine oxidase [Portunus trituberculatus]
MYTFSERLFYFEHILQSLVVVAVVVMMVVVAVVVMVVVMVMLVVVVVAGLSIWVFRHAESPPEHAIMSRGFGTLGKIFLEYQDAWWWEGCEGIQLVWTKDIVDSKDTTSADGSVHGEQQQTGDWWVKGISGFDPVFNHRAVLCGWIGGREAEHMETLSEAEIGQACTRVLRLFLGQQDIPFPKKVYKSQWATNRLFEGSYSYHDSSCNCWSGKKYESHLDTPVLAVDSIGNKAISSTSFPFLVRISSTATCDLLLTFIGLLPLSLNLLNLITSPLPGPTPVCCPGPIPMLVLAGEAVSVQQYSTAHGALQSGIEQATHFVNAQKRLQTIEIVVNVGVSEGPVKNWVEHFKDNSGLKLLSAKPRPGQHQKADLR